jgi:hypothetical protein
MGRRLRRGLIAAALLSIAWGVFFETVTRVGRGWLAGEPFYSGRPASYWACEIEKWETQDPEWRTVRTYTRPSGYPRWMQRFLPEAQWPRLLDGDPEGLAVLQSLRKHPSIDIQDWAHIGVERLKNDERGPYKFTPLDVVFTAELFEVDEDFYKRVTKAAKWHSLAECEQMESVFLTPTEIKPARESLFNLLDRQKLLTSVTDKKIKDGADAVLLSSVKTTTCLPSAAQVRKGNKEPQVIEEGLAIHVQGQVTFDKRYVRLKFVEKGTELEGIDKITVVLDDKGSEGTGAVAAVKESVFSIARNVPDGGSILLPLQYRPASAKEKGRWLVVRVQPRIYMEEEERRIQAGLQD